MTAETETKPETRGIPVAAPSANLVAAPVADAGALTVTDLGEQLDEFGLPPDLAALYGPALTSIANRYVDRDVLPIRAEVVDGVIQTASDGNEIATSLAVADACGTSSSEWTVYLKRQLQRSGGGATVEDRAKHLSAGLTFLQGVKPTNELEAAIGTQMFAAHDMAMRAAQRAATAEFDEVSTTYVGQFTKAARTMAALTEALAKLRTGGKQSVEVKHIHVDNRGGQAVVTDKLVTGTGGNNGIAR